MASQGDDNRKGKLPLLNEGNQKAEKKSDRDVSVSVKVLVWGAMAEELVKRKAGSESGTALPIPSGSSRSQGEQCSQILSLPGPMPMGCWGITNPPFLIALSLNTHAELQLLISSLLNC